jgi:hypothetical protein
VTNAGFHFIRNWSHLVHARDQFGRRADLRLRAGRAGPGGDGRRAAVTGGDGRRPGEQTSLGLAANRAQIVYGNSHLGGLHVGDLITGLTFRVDGGQGNVPAQTVSNYEIRLSKSANAPGSLSSTLAANRGADEVIVHTGPVTIAAGDFTGGPGPNPFGATITFTTPYTFTGGPLLLEYAHSVFPSGGVQGDAAAALADAQSAFGTGFSATTADIGIFTDAVVVQFTVIPEPSALAAVALCAAPMLRRRPRAKR